MIDGDWVSITRVGSAYEEEFDAGSASGRMRHRRRAATGGPVEEWRAGPAPDNPQTAKG